MKKRLATVAAVTLVCGALAACQGTSGQSSFPSKEITLTIPYSAGGGTDTNARIIAPNAGKNLNGGEFVVKNVVGASGTIGMSQVYSAEPDGYTLGMTTSTALVVAPRVLGSTSYQPTSFECVMRLWEVPSLLVVNADSRWNSFKDVVSYAKNNPNKFTFGTSGVGSSHYVAALAIAQEAGIKLKHVPYDGSGPALNAVVAGEVDAAVVGNAVSEISSGQVRGLAALGNAKLAGGIDVPSAKDLGYNVDLPSIGVLVAPPEVPDKRISKVHDAVKQALTSPKVKKRMTNAGYPPLPQPGDACDTRIKNISAQTADVLRKMKGSQ